MPVDPNTPAPLKSDLERMERIVQSFKESLAFTAPEAMPMRWAQLQMDLAELILGRAEITTEAIRLADQFCSKAEQHDEQWSADDCRFFPQLREAIDRSQGPS